MRKTISKITGKQDADIRAKMLQAFARADSFAHSHSRQLMQPVVQYIQPDKHCNMSQWQLVALLEQEVCSFLQNRSAVRQKLGLDEVATKRLLVIAVYADTTLFAVADCTMVAGQAVAVIQKTVEHGKGGRFAEYTFAEKLREKFSDKHLHPASNLTAKMFLPTSKRLFNLADQGIMTEALVDEMLTCDGMPMELKVQLSSQYMSEMLSPLLGAEGKLTKKLKKFFSESLIYPTNLHGVICAGTYASNTWLHQKLVSDFRLPLFASKAGIYLSNFDKGQPVESSCQFNAFSFQSDPDLSPLKEKQLQEQREQVHARQIVQQEIEVLSRQHQKDQEEKLLYSAPTTRLQWVRNGNLANRKMTWHEAQKWVGSLEYAGYKDWRLPTKDELVTFVNMAGKLSSEYLNSKGFNNIQVDYYWSSSTYAGSTDNVWYVGMCDGYVNSIHKDYCRCVWPVRGGQ